MKVSLIQMNSISDKAANLAAAKALMEKAIAEEKPDWMLLPETFDWAGGSRADKQRAAEIIPGGPAYTLCQELARAHGVFIHAGSILERIEGEDRLANTTVVFDREGREIAKYRKIHLFDVTTPEGQTYNESAAIAPGEAVVTYDCEGVTVGCSICYDLRFPASVPGAGRPWRHPDCAAGRLHPADGQGPLGAALPRPRGGDGNLLLRRRADRVFSGRQRAALHLRPFAGRRPLGAGGGACVGRAGHRHDTPRPRAGEARPPDDPRRQTQARLCRAVTGPLRAADRCPECR